MAVEVDITTQHRIEEIAKATGMNASDVVRLAVERYSAHPTGSDSWLARALAFGLVGCSESGPADLSTNQGYFEGFGRG